VTWDLHNFDDEEKERIGYKGDTIVDLNT